MPSLPSIEAKPAEAVAFAPRDLLSLGREVTDTDRGDYLQAGDDQFKLDPDRASER
jgi:hypothetical protein